MKEVAQMLAISQGAAYNLCNSTTEFRVLRAGGSIRIPQDSFDMWLHRAEMCIRDRYDPYCGNYDFQ